MVSESQATSERVADEESRLLVDLNSATTEELETLPGIGPTLAGRVVEYRETVHPFEEPVEIAAVPGISERMYRDLADRLTVTVPSAVKTEGDEAVDETSAVSEAATAVEGDSAEPPDDETGEPYGDEAEVSLAEEPQDESPSVPPSRSKAGLFSGDVGWIWLWSALLGGLLGMIFALVVLVGINGSLVIGNSPAVREMRGQVDGLAADLDSLRGQTDGLRRRLDNLEGLTARMEQVESAVDDLHAKTDRLEQRTDVLEEELVAVSDEIAEIQAQTERFTTFLVQLQLLLDDIFEASDSPTPDPSATSTPPFTPTPTQGLTPTPPASE